MDQQFLAAARQIIRRYARTWDLLLRYDQEKDSPGTRKTVCGMVRRSTEILGALGDLDALRAGRDVSRCGAEG